MHFYLLNSPVLSNWGHYKFEGPITQAKAIATLPPNFVSAIGHESTANLLGHLLQCEVRMNRAQIVMQPGDTALVFRLKKRPHEGAVLNHEQLDAIGYEFGLLHCLEAGGNTSDCNS